jgi:hypothetical protein
MPRLFPGVDPYIESQGRWPDFHVSLLLYLRDSLSARMPQNYIAQMEEHVYMVEAFSDDERFVRPDIAIARDDSSEGRGSSGGAATAILEPVAVELATEMVEDERATWLEIRRLPDMRLVTVIELLSPSNKTGIGRDRYLAKRLSFIASPIHLVELDLLSGGERLPMRKALPKGDYYALVSRAEKRPMSDVYAWSVRDKLPTIPIPLLSPDPDVLIDLAPLYDLSYQNGRYGHVLKYDQPPDVPLDDAAKGWVKEKVAAS